jgi:protease II
MARKEKEKLSAMVVLTEDEKLAYGSELAECHNDKRAVEDNLKSYSTQAKGEIETFNARINALSNKLTCGKELRQVECAIVYNWDKKEKAWIRIDTGEIIRTDTISEEELQEEAKLNE